SLVGLGLLGIAVWYMMKSPSKDVEPNSENSQQEIVPDNDDMHMEDEESHPYLDDSPKQSMAMIASQTHLGIDQYIGSQSDFASERIIGSQQDLGSQDDLESLGRHHEELNGELDTGSQFEHDVINKREHGDDK
ncbi:unnamed protein product, partial [Owenia fusiformis]